MGNGRYSSRLGCSVKYGKVLFEVGGVSEEVAHEALRLAAMKLPVVLKLLHVRK